MCVAPKKCGNLVQWVSLLPRVTFQKGQRIVIGSVPAAG